MFEYLHTVPTDPDRAIGPNNPPLRVYQAPPDTKDVEYDPWAYVEEAPGNVVDAYYGNCDAVSKLITVSLYQSPTPQGRTPNRTQMRRLIEEVNKAVHHVDEDVVPNVFIALHRQAIQPPLYDPKTKGLFGAVRFRMFYFES